MLYLNLYKERDRERDRERESDRERRGADVISPHPYPLTHLDCFV